MTAFRFQLQRVLEWRQTQLELEEVRFKQRLAAVAELDRVRAELEASGIRAELEVRNLRPATGRDLAALASYREHVRSEERRIAARRVERQKELDAQEALMLEARRRCRLLERLKERRKEEWQHASDREVEELASESFLAGWARSDGYAG